MISNKRIVAHVKDIERTSGPAYILLMGGIERL